MEKIETLIAHNDFNIRNNILQTINHLDYVEVIGTANNAEETYSKIINLKPDIVFAEYRKTDSISIIRKSKEKLDNSVPVFNFIINGKNIEDNELKEAIHVLGNKMNSLVSEPINDVVIYILKEYKERQVNTK